MCFAAMATIPAAYMLPTQYSWRLFFYVCLAFACALFVLAFFFVEESSYDREAHMHRTSSPASSSGIVASTEKPDEATVEEAAGTPERKTFIETLSLWGRIDPEVEFFTLMWRSFTYILVPQVLWVITSFGIIIGLGALAFNYTFPIKITAPPYNWPAVSSPLSETGKESIS